MCVTFFGVVFENMGCKRTQSREDSLVEMVGDLLLGMDGGFGGLT